jgi:hypothetical protein
MSDPRVKEAAGCARALFGANLTRYAMQLVTGAQPWPEDPNGKPILPYMFTTNGTPDEVAAALAARVERWEQEQADLACRKELEEEAQREHIRVWIAKFGSEDLRVAHAEGYDVTNRFADEVASEVQRQLCAALVAAGCVDSEPLAVLVEGSTQERACTWEEREAPTARAVLREKQLDVATDSLQNIPGYVEVSRVQRVSLVVYETARLELGEEYIRRNIVGSRPTKITAVLVTICVPGARTRILVFPAE